MLQSPDRPLRKEANNQPVESLNELLHGKYLIVQNVQNLFNANAFLDDKEILVESL